jgi:hypothetical protein
MPSGGRKGYDATSPVRAPVTLGRCFVRLPEGGRSMLANTAARPSPSDDRGGRIRVILIVRHINAESLLASEAMFRFSGGWVAPASVGILARPAGRGDMSAGQRQ